jgi:hypothetical protein
MAHVEELRPVVMHDHFQGVQMQAIQRADSPVLSWEFTSITSFPEVKSSWL